MSLVLCRNLGNSNTKNNSKMHVLKHDSSLNRCVLFAAGTGTGMSHRVVLKCVRFCTTSPLHHLTKKVISCSSGMMTTATPRTTMCANTQKVSPLDHRHCAVVSGCSLLGIVDIQHTLWFYLVLESTNSELHLPKSITKMWSLLSTVRTKQVMCNLFFYVGGLDFWCPLLPGNLKLYIGLCLG